MDPGAGRGGPRVGLHHFPLRVAQSGGLRHEGKDSKEKGFENVYETLRVERLSFFDVPWEAVTVD